MGRKSLDIFGLQLDLYRDFFNFIIFYLEPRGDNERLTKVNSVPGKKQSINSKNEPSLLVVIFGWSPDTVQILWFWKLAVKKEV